MSSGITPDQTPPQWNPAGPQEPAAKSGFLDIGFNRFVSLRLISALWVVDLILIGVAAITGLVFGVFMMNTTSTLSGFLVILLTLIGAVAAALLARLSLEAFAVLFRIAKNTSEIAAKS